MEGNCRGKPKDKGSRMQEKERKGNRKGGRGRKGRGKEKQEEGRKVECRKETGRKAREEPPDTNRMVTAERNGALTRVLAKREGSLLPANKYSKGAM